MNILNIFKQKKVDNKEDTTKDNRQEEITKELTKLGYSVNYIVGNLNKNTLVDYTVYVDNANIERIEYSETYTPKKKVRVITELDNQTIYIHGLPHHSTIEPILDKIKPIIDESRNFYNISHITYKCIDPYNHYTNSLEIRAINRIEITYRYNYIHIANDLVSIHKEYKPNNFISYVNEFNQMVEFFYEDVAEYVNETNKINGYQLGFYKDSIVADKAFDGYIIYYKFKINAYKCTIDIYRDSTHLETKAIIDLSDIHNIVTSYLDKKPKHTTVDIKML